MLHNPLYVNFKCPILQGTCIFAKVSNIRFAALSCRPVEVLSSGLVLVFGRSPTVMVASSRALSVERWESVP